MRAVASKALPALFRFLPPGIPCHIPIQTAFEVLHQLHSSPETENIPFIFLTARVDKNDMRRGMELGADVYLTKETNEVDKTIAERNVVLTQPGRKGTGDWMQYTAVDDVAVLKGNPARVEDVEQGTVEGGRLTVNLREGRVVADDTRGPQSGGRVRSTHKIKKP